MMSAQAAQPPMRPTASRVGIPLVALMAVAVLGGVVVFARLRADTPLPVLDPAPEYELIDAQNRPVSSDDLHGRVVLYNFIYTSCETVCPAMTGQMFQIQNRLSELGLLGERVELVTITFDPDRDTPERLQAYTEQMHTTPDGWLWLTGDPITVKRVVGSGFGVNFERIDPESEESAAHSHGDNADSAAGYDFAHDTAFILVDADGMIRAEYHQFPGVEQMIADIESLVRELP